MISFSYSWDKLIIKKKNIVGVFCWERKGTFLLNSRSLTIDSIIQSIMKVRNVSLWNKLHAPRAGNWNNDLMIIMMMREMMMIMYWAIIQCGSHFSSFIICEKKGSLVSDMAFPWHANSNSRGQLVCVGTTSIQFITCCTCVWRNNDFIMSSTNILWVTSYKSHESLYQLEI